MVDLGLRNTRLKDFYYIWKFAQQFEFKGEVLAEAIRATIARCHTMLPTDVPLALSGKFAEDGFEDQLADRLRDQGTLVVKVIRLFGDFLPPLMAVREDEPFAQLWARTGTWEVKSD
jgi:hypothetical protein